MIIRDHIFNYLTRKCVIRYKVENNVPGSQKTSIILYAILILCIIRVYDLS